MLKNPGGHPTPEDSRVGQRSSGNHITRGLPQMPWLRTSNFVFHCRSASMLYSETLALTSNLMSPYVYNTRAPLATALMTDLTVPLELNMRGLITSLTRIAQQLHMPDRKGGGQGSIV